MGSTRAAVLLAVVLLFAQASCHDVPEPSDAIVAAEETLPSVESVAIEESPLDQILLDTIARHAFPPGVNIDDALQRAVDTNQTDVILSIAEGLLVRICPFCCLCPAMPLCLLTRPLRSLAAAGSAM